MSRGLALEVRAEARAENTKKSAATGDDREAAHQALLLLRKEAVMVLLAVALAIDHQEERGDIQEAGVVLQALIDLVDQ